MSEENEVREQLAYEEMTLAAATIISKIKQFPHLLDQLCEEIEVALVKIALDRSDGNCTKAAKLLGVKRTTLVEKRRRFRRQLGLLDEQ